MYIAQQVLVETLYAKSLPESNLINIVRFLCEESHVPHASGGYIMLGNYILKAKRRWENTTRDKLYKNNSHYKVLYYQAAQQILRSVAESFKSYYNSIKAYREGKITDRPRITN
ncbi:MAG: hypothetical protein QNJ32_17985 [Xenococcaceae cyanobacterium MO_167.B27]|nr:hypothetical protein [Xenococcaceae cyanobacterium MO_167.B27]